MENEWTATTKAKEGRVEKLVVERLKREEAKENNKSRRGTWMGT